MRRMIGMTVMALVAATAAAPAAGAARFTGQLQELHGHRLDGTEVSRTWQVVTSSGSHLLTDPQPPRLLGQQVTVADGDAHAQGVQGRAGPASAQRVVAAPPPGPQTVLVLIITTPDATTPAATPAAVRQAVFTAPDSANAFFGAQSAGATSLAGRIDGSGDVAQVSVSQVVSGCDYEALKAAALAAADLAGWNTAAYDHRVYLLPATRDCPWAGLGSLPGNDVWSNAYLGWSVIAHELGHNMGAHHANGLTCRDGAGTQVPLSANCTSTEYADPFDVMGGGGLMGAWHRQQVGQLAAGEALSLRQSASLTLSAADGLGFGLHNVMVPIKEPHVAVTQWYSLDLRSAQSPFNRFSAGDPVTTGVTIRRVDGLDEALQSQLIDANPGGGFESQPLQPGQTFTDAPHGITIGAHATGGGTVGVDVTMPDLVDDVPPTAVSYVSAAGNTSGVTVSWGAATDDDRVDHYQVLRDGLTIGSSTGLTFTDADTTSLISPTYQVMAVDPTGNVGPARSVQTTLADVTPPAAVGALSASATQSGVVLAWPAAADNRGVTFYEVRRDGSLIATPPNTGYTDRPAPGAHHYSVNAVDAAANRGGQAAADVTMPAPPPPTQTPPPVTPAPGTTVPVTPPPGSGNPAPLAGRPSVSGAKVRIASLRSRRLSGGRRQLRITFASAGAPALRVSVAGRQIGRSTTGRVSVAFVIPRRRRVTVQVVAQFYDGTLTGRWVFA
ncbi:MAG: hypothetical protein QOF77_266 [Solirubrobacteraceae bacterium]|jgi:hypothetical protein|nr:hypothetical protein [Solirubrobacteraceae bacterium]